MIKHRLLTVRGFVMALLPVLLVMAVACGAAEKPAPTAAPAAAKAPVAAPAPIPTVAAVPKAAPTSTPIPAPVAKVHSGKLTIMVGDLASERFDTAFDPGLPGGQSYGRIVGGYLISDNEKKEMVPGIASQWGLSADGLTWTFTIRKGVKFHGGSELTPEDVLWTFQHYFGPQAVGYAVSPSGQRLSRAVDRIELSGPDKVSFTTKQPAIEFPLIISEVATSWFHVMPKRATVHDIAEEAAYDGKPIGAGLMRLEKHVKASVMKFERFDDFYYQPKNGLPEDKRVNFQALDLFLVPEEATRVAALRAGEADIVPASLATKKQVEAGGGRLVFGQEGVYVYVIWHACYEPQQPCQDKRVRQALDYAIDKELIRDRLYGGPTVFQVKGWQAVTPSTIGYTPALDPRPFDPAKARQLVADAGYPGGKGFGKLIVNTYPSTAMPLQVEAAQLAAEFWRRELGLDVEVKVVDSIGIRKRSDAGELTGQILWRDNETRKDATSSMAIQYSDPKHIRRVHNDPELFRLAKETLQIQDPDKSAEAQRKLYPRLRDEAYQWGIGYVNILWAVGPRVLTWQPYPLAVWPSGLHTISLK